MLDELVPLTPVHFFAFSLPCQFIKGALTTPLGKGFELPDLAEFYDGSSFANVYLGWNEEGIACTIRAHKSFDESAFPQFHEKNSIELFFDTRDVKTTGYNTKFCHHFFFLPTPVEVDDTIVQTGEITRFRSDDAHPLCDSKLLYVKSEIEKNKSMIHMVIAKECLAGFDPSQFHRLGFTYRLYRKGGEVQFFSASSDDFTIEQQPSTWASLKLVGKK